MNMIAQRIDGTVRPSRNDAPTIARKVIRDWFNRNPRSVVSFHWRWNALPQSSKEVMATARMATVYPNRIVFGPYQSEMSLSNIAGCHVTDDNRLQIYFDGRDGVAIEYTPRN
jgi:hypothetical protein